MPIDYTGLPAWCREGETATVISGGYQAGIGSYAHAWTVTITRVTRTQVRAAGPGWRHGTEATFDRDTLKERGSTGSARLVDPSGDDDRRVRRQMLVAATLKKISAATADAVDTIRRESSQGHVARDTGGTIDRSIANLDTLIDLKES